MFILYYKETLPYNVVHFVNMHFNNARNTFNSATLRWANPVTCLDYSFYYGSLPPYFKCRQNRTTQFLHVKEKVMNVKHHPFLGICLYYITKKHYNARKTFNTATLRWANPVTCLDYSFYYGSLFPHFLSAVRLVQHSFCMPIYCTSGTLLLDVWVLTFQF